MFKIEGKLKLTQPKEELKHINLNIIKEYVNKLYNTRRVERNWHKLSKENKEKIGFNPNKYGYKGKYYYKDDMKETIKNINNCGNNPSLNLPFFIEEKNGEYFLDSQEEIRGNDLDSISGWLYFLHRELFYHLGIETEGKMEIYNEEEKFQAFIKTTKEGVFYYSPRLKEERVKIDKKRLINFIKENPEEKQTYFPLFLEEISKKIDEKKLKKEYDFEP